MTLLPQTPDCVQLPKRKSVAHEAAAELSRRWHCDVDPIRLALFWLAIERKPDGSNGISVAPLFAGWTADEWQALLNAAQDETMLTWIVHQLQVSALNCPQKLLTELAPQLSTRRQWNRYLGLAALDLCEKLSAQGVEVQILKGAPLSALLYSDASLRDVRDIDLIVSQHDLTAAARALEAMGFKCQVDLHWLNTRHFRRNLREVSFHKLGGAIEVDLHWRVNNGWVGKSVNLKLNNNGPVTQIDLGKKVMRWFSIEQALALSDANIINSHHVEMKASVDRLRLAEYVAKSPGYSRHDIPQLQFSDAMSVIEATIRRIDTMAQIAHLTPTESARDLFSRLTIPKSEPRFFALWARHLRRIRSVSQLVALLLAAISPALQDYMRAKNYGFAALFVRALSRKLRNQVR